MKALILILATTLVSALALAADPAVIAKVEMLEGKITSYTLSRNNQKSLLIKVQAIKTSVKRDMVSVACVGLTDAKTLVDTWATTGKMPTDQAASFTVDASTIQTDLGCQ